MLSVYIEAAMKRAECRQISDGTYFGEIPAFRGVWSSADSPEACLRELREVLEDWIVLGLRHDDPMPEIDGLMFGFHRAEEATVPIAKVCPQCQKFTAGLIVTADRAEWRCPCGWMLSVAWPRDLPRPGSVSP